MYMQVKVKEVALIHGELMGQDLIFYLIIMTD